MVYLYCINVVHYRVCPTENLLIIENLLCTFTDVECGGGFYVRSLVDELGKGRNLKMYSSTTQNMKSSMFIYRAYHVSSVLYHSHCSTVILRSHKGTDQNQARSVHLGGACIEGGSLDVDRHLSSFAALPKATGETEGCKESKINR